jgi:RNA polymerase sigma-70 factor (ECF subfamily)
MPTEHDDDAALARDAARGDRRSLEVLLTRHADRVHALCRRIVPHPEDALDASQEAMIAIARGIGRFDGRSAFTTWLYRVVTNAALDELRRRSRRPIAVDAVDTDVHAPDPPIDTVVSDRVDIDTALATLPAEFRAAVVLRDLCDLDYAEIAEVLEVPPGTVRSRIARGRALLTAALGNPEAPTGRRTNDD